MGVLGDGPLTDLGEAIAAGVFDGDAGSERAEPSDDELEAREARGTSALRLICRERYFRQGRLGSVGQHVDAHGAAITALAAETSRCALEATAVQAHVDDTDQDGDDHNMFCAARRGQYKNEQGESVDNRMVFWKRTRTGFEPYDLTYVPHGSVVKYQVSFRAYSTPNMYGVSCDLGKNVIVLLEGKKNEKRSNTEPDVPYIEF